MTRARLLRHELTVFRATRSQWVFGLLAVVSAVTPLVLTSLAFASDPGRGLFGGVWLVGGFVLPAVVLLSAATRVAGEVDSGRLRLLLGTPVTRRDVFDGVVLFRVGLAVTLCVVAFLPSVTVAAVVSPPTAFGRLTTTALAATALTVVYAVVGVAVSTVAGSRVQALVGGVAVYVLALAWPQLVDTTVGGVGESTVVTLASRLSPFAAYNQAVLPVSEQGFFTVETTGLVVSPLVMLAVILGVGGLATICGRLAVAWVTP